MQLFNLSIHLDSDAGDTTPASTSPADSSDEALVARSSWFSNKVILLTIGVFALIGVTWAAFTIVKRHQRTQSSERVAPSDTPTNKTDTTNTNLTVSASNFTVQKLTNALNILKEAQAELVSNQRSNTVAIHSISNQVADAERQIQAAIWQIDRVTESNIIQNASVNKKPVAKPASAGSGDNGSVRMNNITVSTTGKKSPATIIGIQNNFQTNPPFKPWRSDLIRATNKVEITTNAVSTTNPFEWSIDGDGTAIFQVARNVSFRPVMSMREKFDVWYGDNKSLAVYDFGADSIPQVPRNEDGSYVFVFQVKPLTPVPALAKVSVTPSRKFL